MNEKYNRKLYYNYVDGVLAGTIPACKAVVLACQRFRNWQARTDMYLDEADVDKRIRLIYLMRHYKGVHNGKHFRLLDWQQFAIANIFGWKWKSNGLRVTKKVFIMVARKNGKTALAAAINLCTLICDHENGAEIYCVANNAKQAGIGLTHTQNFAESIDPGKKVFRNYRNEIKMPKTKSTVQVLSSDAMGNDGFNPSQFILDELHASKTWDQWNVMRSGMGMRQQPLSIVITTAGFLIGDDYPCYSMWHTCLDILEGRKQDDTQFSLIYQLDEGDDWRDENVWKKCCPSLDQTVIRDNMREQVQDAINNPGLTVGVLTKNFNMWCNSANIWLPDDLIMNNMQPLKLEDYKDKATTYSFGGVDLSSVSDLTCLSVMWKVDEIYYFKTYYFLPEDSIKESSNSELYKEWRRNGYLIVTPGNVCDYDYIGKLIMDIDKIIPFEKLSYDRWNATQFAIDMTDAGMPLEPYSQAIGNFNQGVKEFERLIRSGKVVLDFNPITRFCFANATLKIDHNENAKPVKGGSKTGKIDGTISITECLGCYLYHHNPMPNLEAVE